ALVGNHETVRKYGVVLDEATVNQELLNMGIEGGNKAATAAEKALARLNLIMAGTTDAQGDAIRTADSFTNRFRALKSSIIDLSESFGNLLLPTIQKLVEGITKAVKFINNLDEDQKKLIITVAGLAAAIGPLLIVVGQMVALFAAMSGPAGWITLAVIAVVALSVAIWKLNEASREEKKLEREVIALKDQLTRARGEERIAILETTLAKQKERIETLKGTEAEMARRIEIARRIGTAPRRQEIEELNEIKEKLSAASSEYAILALQIKSAYEQQKVEIEQRKILLPIIEEHKDALSSLNDEYRGGEDDLQGWISKQTEIVAGFKEMSQAQLGLTGLTGQFIDTLGGVSEATSEVVEKISIEFTDVLSSVASAFSDLGSISSQFYKNRGIEIDNDYARRKAVIEANILDEEARETALSALDEEFNIKRKQLQRDQAIASRTTGIFDAILNTTGAIMQTFKTFGFPLGVPFAAIMGALGAAKVAAIASQPLPELAEGGIIREPTVLLAGERGPEKIIPLSEEPIHITIVTMDNKTLYDKVTKASRNRQIRIDVSSLVN
ncbi:MAG TPA: phage tail tape measure protein, partial [bacterium]|nr:phage tail tape measure protein [bacterium]